MDKVQAGEGIKAGDCDKSRCYQSSSPTSSFMRSSQQMVMALGGLDHAHTHSQAQPDNATHSPDSCWTTWESQQSNNGSIEAAAAAADYSANAWDMKGGWDWGRLAAPDFDLPGAAAPKPATFNLSPAPASGIPGLAPTGSTFDHSFAPDARNGGIEFRVKSELETPLGLDPLEQQQQQHQQQQSRKSASLQDMRASSLKNSPNASMMSEMESQQQSQTHKQRGAAQASMLVMGSSMEQQRRLMLGLGGAGREVEDGKGEEVKEGVQSNGNVNGNANGVAAGESALGLKLGRRTYFEDGPSGVNAAGGSRSSANSPAFAGSPPGKKPRSQPPAIQVPRCQVEGCKADLSNVKEYHRRHKVCEVHSKSSKVIVNKQEQRFCQQCSRFHELAEFDEGKRSCRRRLAGHNERRRKQQPESSSTIPCVNPCLPSGSFYGDEDKRCYMGRGGPSSSTSLEDCDENGGSLCNNLKVNHGKSAWSGMGRMDEQSSLACQMGVVGGGERGAAYLGRVPLAHPATTSDRLLMLLQSSPKNQMVPMAGGGVGVHQFLQGSGAGGGGIPIGQGLTLSSSSGAGASVLAGLEATPASQGLSGISDSGRALSLLSSQPWGSRAPGPVSLDHSPRSTLTLDQILAENRAPLAQQLMSGSSSSTASAGPGSGPGPGQQQPNSPGSMGHASTSGDRDHHQAPFISAFADFGGHSMLALLQGQEMRALQAASVQHVRPTIDLMQLPSQQSQSSLHGSSRIGPLPSQPAQYSDYSLRGFESSMFDTQQML